MGVGLDGGGGKMGVGLDGGGVRSGWGKVGVVKSPKFSRSLNRIDGCYDFLSQIVLFTNSSI